MFLKKLFQGRHSKKISNAIVAIRAMIFVVDVRENVAKTFLRLVFLQDRNSH
jgi:hypothetical protein